MQANILHNIEFKNLQMNDGTVFLALSNLNKEKLQIHSLKRIPFKEKFESAICYKNTAAIYRRLSKHFQFKLLPHTYFLFFFFDYPV